MRNRSAIHTPKLFSCRWLVSAVAVVFMLALGSSIVSLPFSNRLNRNALLNSQEEEHSCNNNNFNEEHKCGKSLHSHFLEFSDYLKLAGMSGTTYGIPRNTDLYPAIHARRIIQPPEC